MSHIVLICRYWADGQDPTLVAGDLGLLVKRGEVHGGSVVLFGHDAVGLSFPVEAADEALSCVEDLRQLRFDAILLGMAVAEGATLPIMGQGRVTLAIGPAVTAAYDLSLVAGPGEVVAHTACRWLSEGLLAVLEYRRSHHYDGWTIPPLGGEDTDTTGVRVAELEELAPTTMPVPAAGEVFLPGPLSDVVDGTVDRATALELLRERSPHAASSVHDAVLSGLLLSRLDEPEQAIITAISALGLARDGGFPGDETAALAALAMILADHKYPEAAREVLSLAGDGGA